MDLVEYVNLQTAAEVTVIFRSSRNSRKIEREVVVHGISLVENLVFIVI